MRHFSSGGFEFEGDISPQAFNVSRIISYRNSCIQVTEKEPIEQRITTRASLLSSTASTGTDR